MPSDSHEKLAKLRSLVPTSDTIALVAQTADNDSGIIGVRIRFDKDTGAFLDRDNVPLQPDFQPIVFDIRGAFVKWENGHPTQKIWHVPGQHFPKRAELGDLDRSRWERSPFDGQPLVDPWRIEFYMVLADRETADPFTFVTATKGAKSAVIELARPINTRRQDVPGTRPIIVFKAIPYYLVRRPYFLPPVEWLDNGLAPTV